MPNDSKLIEVMARAICNHEDGDERHIDWHTKVAQAALDAIAEAGYAVVSYADLVLLLDEWGRDDPLQDSVEAYQRLSDLVRQRGGDGREIS